MSIMTEQFDRIAREGLIQDMLKKLQGKASPVEQKVMVRFNYHVNQELDKTKKDILSRLDELPNGTDEMVESMMSAVQASVKVAFTKTLEECRQENDWEAYGFTSWMKGTMGIR